jgi:hypothetical protein
MSFLAGSGSQTMWWRFKYRARSGPSVSPLVLLALDGADKSYIHIKYYYVDEEAACCFKSPACAMQIQHHVHMAVMAWPDLRIKA